MGKPPRKDEPDSTETPRDPDRAAILARRQRFIALALTGLTTGACDTPSDDSGACLKVDVVEPKQQVPESGESPSGKPCLNVAPPEPEPEPKPHPCLKVAAPDPEPKPEPKPHPCLKVAAPKPDPKPHPCLKVRPPEPEPEPEKPKPQPCLRVAKPK